MHFATFPGEHSAFEAFSAPATRLGTRWVPIWPSACTNEPKKTSIASSAVPETSGEWAMAYTSGRMSRSTSGNVIVGERSNRSPRIISDCESRDISEVEM